MTVELNTNTTKNIVNTNTTSTTEFVAATKVNLKKFPVTLEQLNQLQDIEKAIKAELAKKSQNDAKLKEIVYGTARYNISLFANQPYNYGSNKGSNVFAKADGTGLTADELENTTLKTISRILNQHYGADKSMIKAKKTLDDIRSLQSDAAKLVKLTDADINSGGVESTKPKEVERTKLIPTPSAAITPAEVIKILVKLADDVNVETLKKIVEDPAQKVKADIANNFEFTLTELLAEAEKLLGASDPNITALKAKVEGLKENPLLKDIDAALVAVTNGVKANKFIIPEDIDALQVKLNGVSMPLSVLIYDVNEVDTLKKSKNFSALTNKIDEIKSDLKNKIANKSYGQNAILGIVRTHESKVGFLVRRSFIKPFFKSNFDEIEAKKKILKNQELHDVDLKIQSDQLDNQKRSSSIKAEVGVAAGSFSYFNVPVPDVNKDAQGVVTGLSHDKKETGKANRDSELFVSGYGSLSSKHTFGKSLFSTESNVHLGVGPKKTYMTDYTFSGTLDIKDVIKIGGEKVRLRSEALARNISATQNTNYMKVTPVNKEWYNYNITFKPGNFDKGSPFDNMTIKYAKEVQNTAGQGSVYDKAKGFNIPKNHIVEIEDKNTFTLNFQRKTKKGATFEASAGFRWVNRQTRNFLLKNGTLLRDADNNPVLGIEKTVNNVVTQYPNEFGHFIDKIIPWGASYKVKVNSLDIDFKINALTPIGSKNKDTKVDAPASLNGTGIIAGATIKF